MVAKSELCQIVLSKRIPQQFVRFSRNLSPEIGLEDQLLAEVVKADRPDLEEQKAELTRQQNEYKILLKSLEDDLLVNNTLFGHCDVSSNLQRWELETKKVIN